MIELLKEADMVLNACGRPKPPEGYRWVDLFYAIPFFQLLTNPPETPFQARVSNNSDTVFVCRGIAWFNGGPSIRIRWPDGTYFSQLYSFTFAFPAGVGPQQLALPQERHIMPGARISIEMAGNESGLVQLAFWGVKRYLLKETSGSSQASASSCIVGYAANPQKFSSDASKLMLMPDPAAALAAMPRIKCGPNQNIMAPEWALGNQCTAETPAGYEDESFTFFSPAYVVPANGQNYNNALIIPGDSDVVIKNIQGFVTYQGGLFAIPTLQIRLPNGYSLTGGDMVPLNLWPGGTPVFPTLRVAYGGRLIIDLADSQASINLGSSTIILQFDGVKRRKVAAA